LGAERKKKSEEVSSRSRHREKVRICGALTARVELGEERRERSRLMLVNGRGKGGEESKKTVSWGARVMQDVLVLKLSLHVIPPLFFSKSTDGSINADATTPHALPPPSLMDQFLSQVQVLFYLHPRVKREHSHRFGYYQRNNNKMFLLISQEVMAQLPSANKTKQYEICNVLGTGTFRKAMVCDV